MRSSFRHLAAAAALIAAGAIAGSMIAGGRAPSLATPAVASAAVATGFSTKTKTENSVTRIVRQVSPSIITVGVQKKTVTAQPWFDSFLTPRMRYTTERQRIPFMGSGFIVSDDGLAITNYHVIDNSESIFVTTSDGREFPAKLVEADSFIDIALLKIDSKGEKLPPRSSSPTATPCRSAKMSSPSAIRSAT